MLASEIQSRGALLAEVKALIERKSAPDKRAFTFRGAAAELQGWRGGEVIIAGPAETGKTVAALHYLHCLMLDHPGAQGAIIRKVQADMPGTCIQTFEKKVLPPGALEYGLVRSLGATKPERYIYKNGSVVWVGGMDNPGKTLSSERDFIYVNQAEELRVEDWETIGTRATGRAGNAPFSLLFGDCNPAHAKHWILQREAVGLLAVLKSYHNDNPILYDAAGGVTEQGKRTLGILGGLSAGRRKRLFLGIWAADDEDALWTRDNIDRVSSVPDLFSIYVGVDPSGSAGGDECGIVVVGGASVRNAAGKKAVHLYVLEDASMRASSDVWAQQVITCYHKWRANKVIAEKNFGGDMVAQVLKAVRDGGNVPIKLVSASRGKAVRAEPVAAVYKEERGHHVGKFDELEDEMCTWTPKSNYSPGRLDALVWGGTELIGKSTGGGRGT